MSENQERACLFHKNARSGKREPVERILPKSVIGFMNATPWCGETRDHRRTNAMDRITNFLSTVTGQDTAQPLSSEKICGYASPECIDIENRWTRISKEKDLETYQERFVEKFLIPLVSSHEDGNPVRLNVEDAKKNMRLTLIGFSYGGMFIAGVRKALIQKMEELGYEKGEIKEIFSQVYQVNFGVQRSDNDQIEPRFNERNIVTRDDNQGIWESYVEQKGNFVLVNNASEVQRSDGKKMTKPHSQDIYMNAIAGNAELCGEIRKNLDADFITPTTDINTPDSNSYISTRLAELSYRLQMMRRD